MREVRGRHISEMPSGFVCTEVYGILLARLVSLEHDVRHPIVPFPFDTQAPRSALAWILDLPTHVLPVRCSQASLFTATVNLPPSTKITRDFGIDSPATPSIAKARKMVIAAGWGHSVR